MKVEGERVEKEGGEGEGDQDEEECVANYDEEDIAEEEEGADDVGEERGWLKGWCVSEDEEHAEEESALVANEG